MQRPQRIMENFMVERVSRTKCKDMHLGSDTYSSVGKALNFSAIFLPNGWCGDFKSIFLAGTQ